jgi:hypothetical protein
VLALQQILALDCCHGQCRAVKQFAQTHEITPNSEVRSLAGSPDQPTPPYPTTDICIRSGVGWPLVVDASP